MAPFNLITTAGCSANGVVLGLHHTWSNWPMLCCRARKVQVGRLLDPIERRGGLSASFSPSFCGSRPLLTPDYRRGVRFLLQCNDSKIVSSKIDGNSKEKQNHLGISRRPGSRKRFLLRLRPRLRLISYRLRRVSVRRLVENARTIWHRNSKRLALSAWASFALGLCILFLKCTARHASVNVPYSEFVLNLQRGCVSAVQFEEDSRYIYFNKYSDEKEGSRMMDDASVSFDVSDDSEPKSPDIVANAKEKRKSSIPKWKYSTRKVDHDESFLLGLMRDKGTMYSSAPQSAMKLLRSLVLTLITLWIPLAPMLWLLYRQFNANNSPAKKRRPSKQSVTFDDVEGVDAAKEELMEIVSCLKGSIDYKMLGAKLPRGVLLVGPPGTGKTLLARSVAGEAGIPFFSVSASEFVELFVGRGAARVRDLFSVAKESAPSIVFIDELDAVGGKRGRSFNDERDQTLNQLLTEMDGFESDTRVIIIAATNRPEALDPALCRPGRFSRKVVVGEPDFEGRKKILAVHLRQVPLEEETDIICSLVASLTTGLVGADLANIVNESALLAARRGGNSITREDIMEAIERAKYGIDERRLNPSGISKGLGDLFPWMPSLLKKNGMRRDGPQDFMGYQTLS